MENYLTAIDRNQDYEEKKVGVIYDKIRENKFTPEQIFD